MVSLVLNKPKLDNLATDIWKSAVRLSGKFKAYEYQGVILPISANYGTLVLRVLFNNPVGFR